MVSLRCAYVGRAAGGVVGVWVVDGPTGNGVDGRYDLLPQAVNEDVLRSVRVV